MDTGKWGQITQNAVILVKFYEIMLSNPDHWPHHILLLLSNDLFLVIYESRVSFDVFIQTQSMSYSK